MGQDSVPNYKLPQFVAEIRQSLATACPKLAATAGGDFVPNRGPSLLLGRPLSPSIKGFDVCALREDCSDSAPGAFGGHFLYSTGLYYGVYVCQFMVLFKCNCGFSRAPPGAARARI